MTFVIGDPCIDVKDRSCVDNCPVDCIYEGKTKLYVHPDECIDCGACEAVCPVEAIFSDILVPEDQEGHIEANRLFVEQGELSGGAANAGPRDFDVLATAPKP